MIKNNNQNPFIYIKMFCEHGLTKETCPYCMQQSRIKPPTRLVKLAPTELPMEIPMVNDLQKPISPIKELYKEKFDEDFDKMSAADTLYKQRLQNLFHLQMG